MSDIKLINMGVNRNLSGDKDDVDPPQENSMATNLPSVNETKSVLMTTVTVSAVGGAKVSTIVDIESAKNSKFNNNDTKLTTAKNTNLHKNNKESSSSGGDGGGGESVKDGKLEHLNRNNLNIKRKRRRRKSNRSKNYYAYAKSAWKFQMPRPQKNQPKSDMITLVPYNTNKFLMEDHMPGEFSPRRRTRESSFSVDSEENYFYALPEDEEEFLTKEFSSVYEDARVERLEGMTKQQLIQEYLQLQANFDQLSRRHAARAAPHEDEHKMRTLEEKVNQLTNENISMSSL